MKIKIEEIKLKNRIREELGDLADLEHSIKTYGLFNPILVNQDYELLAGARRLFACKNLGWTEIEVKFIETSDELMKLEIESHENLMRKDFTQLEVEKIIERKTKLVEGSALNSFITFFKRIFLAIGQFLSKIFTKKKSDQN